MVHRNTNVNLGNLVLSLSDTMDLASPLLTQHQMRTAFIVMQMGKAAKYPGTKLENLFIAALLHDIGAFSLEEKIAIRNSELRNVEEHCIRGESLLSTIPLLKDAAKIVRFHHQGWSSWKDPIEDSIVIDSQLLFLADFVERQIVRNRYILHQHHDIIKKISSLSGYSIHPHVADLFIAISRREEFWLDLVSGKLYAIMLNESPFRTSEIDFSEIAIISKLFRDIIDFKSRFTATHSFGVAAAASMMAGYFGLSDTEIGLMEVAGNLHDLGKLAIPNSILDKPAGLTKAEMAIMKSHTYYTYSVINMIEGLDQIADGQHITMKSWMAPDILFTAAQMI